MTVVYRQQMSYCGKERCQKCRIGIGHGPYWYSYQNVGGQTKRTYLGKHRPPEGHNPPPAPPEPEVSPLIRLCTLGQFRLDRRRAEGDWETVTSSQWYQQGVSRLLACLLTPERSLHREQVIDAIWSSDQQDQALLNSRLDRQVYNVRHLFEPTRPPNTRSSLLTVDHDRFALSRTLIWTDVDAFETQLSEAMACDDPALHERLLSQADQLYGGDFLPDERHVTSVRLRREALHRKWIGLLLALCDVRSQREDLHTALEPLERLIRSDPANEAAVQRQIKLLSQLGRRSEGLRAYTRLVTAIKEAYHIAPLPETRALYDALRRGTPVPSPAPTHAAPPAPDVLRQPPPSIGRQHTTHLVGRESERQRVDAVLDGIVRTRRLTLSRQTRAIQQAQPRDPHGLLLLGAIGIGKTRLAEACVEHAARTGWQVVWSRAYRQEHLIAYHVWVDLLRQAMQRCVWPRDELRTTSLVYQPLGVLLPELLPLMHEVIPPVRGPEQEEMLLWEAILAWLIVLSKDAPLLLVIDDMHWIDARSLQLWSYLLRRIPGSPIVLLGTCREDEAQPLMPLLAEMERERSGTALLLHPLAQEHISQLLAPLALSPTMHAQIVTRAAGNPFFAEELARQAIVPTPPAEEDAPDRRRAPAPALPRTIDDALQMRLNRLSPPCQRLLARAAVLGDAFEWRVIDVLERQTRSTPQPDQTLELLEEAITAGILLETAPLPTQIRYQFWHPLFASHLYDHLSAARRARTHRQAANALEEVARAVGTREVEAQAAAIVAHVHAGAGEPTRLAHYAALAGDRAAAMLDCTEAERLYRLAIETHADLHTHGPQVQLLWERLADVKRILCQGPEAKAAYEQALALHLAFPDPVSSPQRHATVHAMYLVEIAHTQYNSAQLQEAQETLARARTCLLMVQVPQGTVWGALEYIGAYVLWKQGAYEHASISAHTALACFEAALAEPRTVIPVGSPSHLRRTLAGDPVDIGRVHRFLGALLSSSASTVSSSVQEALEHQQRARAIFEQHGYLREAGSILCDIGNVYLQQAEHRSADTYFQQCLQATERIGDTGIQCVAWCNRGIVAQREGRYDEARTYSERALALAQAAQDPVYEIMVRCLLATLLVESAHLDEARAQLIVICTLARQLRNRPCTGMAFVTLASYHLSQVEQQSDAADTPSSTRCLTRVACELEYALTMHLDTDFYLEALLLSARVQWLLGNKRAKADARQLVEQCAQIGAIWMQKRGEQLQAEMRRLPRR